MTTQQFSLDERPRRHPDSAFRPIGDEGGLVVLAGKAEVKVLNPVGIAVFALLDGLHSVREIVAAVAEDFDVGGEQALTDVQEFLADLGSQGMLMAPEAESAQETS